MVAGTPPVAQVDLVAAYDPVANAMALFGGASSLLGHHVQRIDGTRAA